VLRLPRTPPPVPGAFGVISDESGVGNVDGGVDGGFSPDISAGGGEDALPRGAAINRDACVGEEGSGPGERRNCAGEN
jgi:hypothetical protein